MRRENKSVASIAAECKSGAGYLKGTGTQVDHFVDVNIMVMVEWPDTSQATFAF
jgi:hypothetical protein